MCPDREVLSAWADGELEAHWAGIVEEHARACPDCQAFLVSFERTRRLLQGEPVPDWREPMERVRRAILASEASHPTPIPVWRRRVVLPVPLAATAVLLMLLLAGALVLSVGRTSFGLVRISRALAGGTEIRIAAPITDLEGLLKSIDREASFGEDVIKLPKNVQLLPVGEPRMGKEDEFLGRKPR